jgi:nucleoside-diphosphate-sugar epimerase
MCLKNNFLLTGATGVIGSHVLYELLKLKTAGLLHGEIALPVRPANEKTPEQRISDILHPALRPEYLGSFDTASLMKHVSIINSDLRTPEKIRTQLGEDAYTVLHLASSVNLSTLKKAKDEIIENNYHGTLNFLEAIGSHCQKFVFVSTAYSSGHRSGLIEDEFLEITNKDFRNPYEFYKAKTEDALVKRCKEHGIQWQILRPSIVCGRMIDPPFFVISRYLVFYLFGAFFFKLAHNGGMEKLRIQINPQSGMNMIPVDYTAKAIVRASAQPLQELNIVSANNLPNAYIIETIFNKTGVQEWEYVTEMPDGLNKTERLYYCTVGRQFNPYWNTSPHSFSAKKLRALMPDIPEPNVANCFAKLFEHALERQFSDPLTDVAANNAGNHINKSLTDK